MAMDMVMDLVMDSRDCVVCVTKESERVVSHAGERSICFHDGRPSLRGDTGVERMAAAGAIREIRPVQEGDPAPRGDMP